MTTEQERFVLLHKRTSDAPFKWVWHFGGSLLRAYTERGHTASISATGLGALIDAGLAEIVGVAGVRLTAAGMAS